MSAPVFDPVTWRGTALSPGGCVRLSFHRPDGTVLRLELARGCAVTVADTIDDYLGPTNVDAQAVVAAIDEASS